MQKLLPILALSLLNVGCVSYIDSQSPYARYNFEPGPQTELNYLVPTRPSEKGEQYVTYTIGDMENACTEFVYHINDNEYYDTKRIKNLKIYRVDHDSNPNGPDSVSFSWSGRKYDGSATIGYGKCDFKYMPDVIKYQYTNRTDGVYVISRIRVNNHRRDLQNINYSNMPTPGSFWGHQF